MPASPAGSGGSGSPAVISYENATQVDDQDIPFHVRI
jgi:hypothetical protein